MKIYKAKTVGELHSAIDAYLDKYPKISFTMLLLFLFVVFALSFPFTDASLKNVENTTIFNKTIEDTTLQPMSEPVLSEEGKRLLAALHSMDKVSHIFHKCKLGCIPQTYCNTLTRKLSDVDREILMSGGSISLDESIKVYDVFEKEKYEKLYGSVKMEGMPSPFYARYHHILSFLGDRND